MSEKEKLILGIYKGKEEIKEHKKEIKRLQKQIERYSNSLEIEMYNLEMAQRITKKLEKELKEIKED